MPATPVTAWWTMTFISPRHGSRIPTSPCVPNAVFHRAGSSLQKIRLHRIFSTVPFRQDGFGSDGSDAMPHMAVTKEIPCVIRPSGQCAKPGRSSGSPMGTGNSYGRLQKTNQAQRFIIRVVSCRKDGNRNYVKPGEAVWLYARRYEDGTIKYFVSNAPDHISYT